VVDGGVRWRGAWSERENSEMEAGIDTVEGGRGLSHFIGEATGRGAISERGGKTT
jgi:hypothetical protein